MKINGQLTYMSKPAIPPKRLNKQAFEQWIDHGDEYYRQHQAQLEQSSLHFDSQPVFTQQKHSAALITSASQENPSSPSTATSFAPTHQHALPNEPQNTVPNFMNNPLITQGITHLDMLLNPTFTLDKEPISQVNIVKTDAEKDVSPTQPFIQVKLKNHHLFIQEQQVELTLNTEELNPKDQKELVHMLKNHLKNKSLTLSQLIINGVHHD